VFLCFWCLYADDGDIDGIDYTFQVCPACGQKVGMDLVAHITTQHAKFFKISFLKVGFLVLVCISLLVRFLLIFIAALLMYVFCGNK